MKSPLFVGQYRHLTPVVVFTRLNKCEYGYLMHVFFGEPPMIQIFNAIEHNNCSLCHLHVFQQYMRAPTNKFKQGCQQIRVILVPQRMFFDHSL